MLNRCLFLFCLLFGFAVAPAAGEEFMPMVPGADWQTAQVAGESPQLRKNMVRLTLPSVAARTPANDLLLEKPDIGFSDIPGLARPENLAREPYAAPERDIRSHHVPEEMRFPMETPFGTMIDGSIASPQGFNAMLNDLVVFDAEPIAPVASPARTSLPVPAFIPPAPAPVAVLPMPSEILRNDSAGRVVESPYVPFVAPEAYSFAPEQPAAVSVADFGGAPEQTGVRTRRIPPARPEPQGFTPMRETIGAGRFSY